MYIDFVQPPEWRVIIQYDIYRLQELTQLDDARARLGRSQTRPGLCSAELDVKWWKWHLIFLLEE